MYIDIIKNKLILTFNYNPVIISIVRNFEGRIFNNVTKDWTVPIVHIVHVVDTLRPAGFMLSKEVAEEYRQNKLQETKIQQILSGEISEENVDKIKQLNLPLFNFQQRGVHFLSERQSAILADEPGLGKTIQSLATTLLNKSKKNLIVCPSSLKLQWQEEINKWIPTAKTFIISGNKKRRSKLYDEARSETTLYYIIINYELILRDIHELSKF